MRRGSGTSAVWLFVGVRLFDWWELDSCGEWLFYSVLCSEWWGYWRILSWLGLVGLTAVGVGMYLVANQTGAVGWFIRIRIACNVLGWEITKIQVREYIYL